MIRRDLLKGLALGASAAIIPMGVLMPIRKIIVPSFEGMNFTVSEAGRYLISGQSIFNGGSEYFINNEKALSQNSTGFIQVRDLSKGDIIRMPQGELIIDYFG